MANHQFVKMFALIDGSPSEIGQCHAGQARLLRKKGLAEWKDGKLWLLAASAPSTVNITLPADTDPEDVLVALAGGPWNTLAAKQRRDIPDQVVDKEVRRMTFPDDPAYVEAILEEAGVDTEGWEALPMFRQGCMWNTVRDQAEYADVPVNGGPALLFEFRRRLGLGHETCGYDDPRARRIGFLDYDAKEYVFSALTAFKETCIDADDAAAFGLTVDEVRDRIACAEGRASLFGDGGFGTGNASGPLKDIDWGEMPPNVSKVFNPDLAVGLIRVAAPVRLPPLKAEEDAQERIERIRNERRKAYQFPLVNVPGWTYFTASDTHDVIPVLDNEGNPHPSPSEEPVYGLFKRAHDRVFRVWVQGRDAGWDESRLLDDSTYRLTTEHTLPGKPAHEHVSEAVRLVEVRLAELAADKETTHEVGPGWTKFFKFEDCPPVFYMDIPPDLAEEFNKRPYRSEPMTEEEKASFVARMVRTPYTKLHGETKPVYGFYQVVGDRLFRVLGGFGETCFWDESVRAPDGSYTLQGEGRAIDKIYGASGHCDLLAPSGFPDTIKAAERRIAEYLTSPDGKWEVTRHDAVTYPPKA